MNASVFPNVCDVLIVVYDYYITLLAGASRVCILPPTISVVSQPPLQNVTDSERSVLLDVWQARNIA